MVGAQGGGETSSAPVSLLGLYCAHGLSRLNCPGLLLGLDLRGQGRALERSGAGEREDEHSHDPGLAGLGLQREQRGGATPAGPGMAMTRAGPGEGCFSGC